MRIKNETDMTLHILSLKERPEYVDTCAAWSFGEWGCHIEGATLARSCERYKHSMQHEGLPKTWIALKADKIAGIISLRETDHPNITDYGPWLASLFVHPAFRGQGIGKRLCCHLEGQAKKRFGFRKLYLFTHDADGLYKSLGWQEMGRVPDPKGISAQGEILMEKVL